jgi:thiol-disulfide isomerase/thioredoxin
MYINSRYTIEMFKKPIHFIGMALIVLVVLYFLTLSYEEGFESGKSVVSRSVIITKADWCGHCKKAAPEFDKLVAASPITLQDGTKATVKILDADTDKEEITKLKIKGYPTILIKNGGKTIEYPGDRTSDGITAFLNRLVTA